MKVTALLFALSLLTVAHPGFAAEEGPRFIQTKSEATTLARSRNWTETKTDVQHDLRVARHYVTSYQLVIEELFGFHFQCVSSSVWAKELNEEENPESIKVYLANSCMTYADPEEGYSPYAYASWSGLLLIHEPSTVSFNIWCNYYYSLPYGAEVTNQLTIRTTRLGTDDVAGTTHTDLSELRNGEGPSYIAGADMYAPGVYEIEVIMRSFFSRPAGYHVFNNLQGGSYVEIRTSTGSYCDELGTGHSKCD
jgi:hypothetical protein